MKDCKFYKVCEEQGGYEGSNFHTEAEAQALDCPMSFTKDDKGKCSASACMAWKWVKSRPPSDPPVGFCLRIA